MSEIARELLKRWSSRKFLAAAAGFTVILLQGFGYASFSDEVLTISAATVFGYPVIEGAHDIVRARSGGS